MMVGKIRKCLRDKTIHNVLTSHLSEEDKRCIIGVFIEYEHILDKTEVKHSEWVLHPDGSGTCKNCNTHQKSVWDMDNWQNHCGHCGADMDATDINVSRK